MSGEELGTKTAHDFARLLRELRIRAGLTQEELAVAAGLSPRALGNLERDRSAPHRATAVRLAEALRLSAADAQTLRRLAGQRAAGEYPQGSATTAITETAADNARGATADPTEEDRAAPGTTVALDSLPAEDVRLVAVIGLHPGTHASADALAAASAATVEETRCALERLAGFGLIALSAGGDVEACPSVHASARALAMARLTGAERAAACARLAGWYLATADEADRLISPLRFRASLAQAVAGRPRRVFSGRAAAIGWCDANQANFGAMAEIAHRSDDSRPAWQIPWALGGYFELRRPAELSLRIHQIGLASARESKDLLGQAGMLLGLGIAHYFPRRFDDAAACFRQSRELWRLLAEQAGEAGALNCLGNVNLETRRFSRAISHYRGALRLYQRLGDRRGEAVVLTNLAETYCEAQDYAAAAKHAREAVLVGRESAFPRIEAMAACQLSRALSATGRADEAADLFDQALALSREASDRHALAWTLSYLGHHHLSLGAADRAEAAWLEAVALFDDLADPHAADLRAQILTLRS